VLQPLEESGLHYFSRALVSGASETDKKHAFRHLELILKLDLLLSLAFVCIAPWYTKPLVHLMLGRRWASTSMPTVLAAYCLQIPSMAYCGILEAFMNSTLTPDWYQTVKRASVGISALYIGAALILVRRFETLGLVAAGALSFALRAALGLYYLRDYMLKQKVLCSLNPWLERPILVAFVSTAVISAAMFLSQSSIKMMVAVGGTCAVALAFSLARWERQFLVDLRHTFIAPKLKST
jgi:oligosaccharide translocation protein RFT1